MSGLEIAGVVLGVIPIVQIGIEQIKGKRLKALIKHQQTIASFSRKFELEHALFHANLEKLLVSISDEETASILLVNLTGPGWKDDDLSESLQEHLGERSYQAYYSALTDLAALLAELQEELGLDDSGNQIRVDKWSDKVAKRIKDYIKHKNHLSVLETIKELNEALHRLTGDVLELAPIRANRRTKLDTKRWESLRKLAENLHDTLKIELCCSHAHMAHLRLEGRTDRAELEVRFSVLFAIDVYPRTWQEMEINILPPEEAVHPPSPAQSPANSPPKVGKSVAWSPDTQNGQTPQTQEMTVLSPSDNRISSLCKELLKKRHAAGCIGFLDDEENREYYVHSVYPSNSEGNDLSLAQLLSRNDPSNAHALLLRDKYELSVILATSVLQLHTTPWLEDGLWKEDVRFVRTKMKTQSAPYAYIQKRFESVSSNGTSPRRYSSSNPTIRNDTIFALGVSLIELSLGRTLRSFAEEQDLGPDGQPNEVTDLSIARRLLTERIQPSEGERYANAVNRCIHCLFDGINPSLEDDAFRHAFYQGAVVPLKEIRDEFIK